MRINEEFVLKTVERYLVVHILSHTRYFASRLHDIVLVNVRFHFRARESSESRVHASGDRNENKALASPTSADSKIVTDTFSGSQFCVCF